MDPIMRTLLNKLAEVDPYVRQVLIDRGIEDAIDAANEEKRGLFDDDK